MKGFTVIDKTTGQYHDCSDCPFLFRPIMCQGAVLERKKWLESETDKSAR